MAMVWKELGDGGKYTVWERNDRGDATVERSFTVPKKGAVIITFDCVVPMRNGYVEYVLTKNGVEVENLNYVSVSDNECVYAAYAILDCEQGDVIYAQCMAQAGSGDATAIMKIFYKE